MERELDIGLERVVAASTSLSNVQGLEGRLTIAGFPAEEIAPRATFEEMIYLLWNGTLPDQSELQSFRDDLAQRREVPTWTLDLLASAAARDVPPMDALRMGIASIVLDDEADPVEQSMQIVSQTATIVAAYQRLQSGARPVSPDPGLTHTADLLRMIENRTPEPARVRALETYLNTVVDHGLNASTFTARVIVSTASDFVSAVAGAVGALKGPLHGGAPGPALDMVFEIGTLDRAERFLRDKLDQGERLMGFGHRVYRVRDPRADILEEAASQLHTEASGDRSLYDLATGVEKIALRLLEEYKPGRDLQTNVEYYTALLLHSLGFASQTFTPIFAAGRVAGWLAHCQEQQSTGRLIRPSCSYVGKHDLRWVPIDQR
jgi:citrate synthase